MAPQALEAAHKDAQARGVEEVNALEIDDDAVLSFADQLDQALAEARCRVDVDLAAHGQNGVAVAFRDVEPEIDRRASYPGVCTQNLASRPVCTVIPACDLSSITW